MDINQAYEVVYKVARKCPLDGDSHDLVKTALSLVAKYIVEKEKKDEHKVEAGGVHKE